MLLLCVPHGELYDVAANNISRLPDLFHDEQSLPALTELSLERNKMVFPPQEVCDRGVSAIRAFFAAYRQGAA